MKGGGVFGLLFDLCRKTIIMKKIAKAPKNPTTPAPPIKATTTDSIPWGISIFLLSASDVLPEWLLIAGQVERGAHFEVPL